MSGQLFVVTAPSGAGKTTLTRMLLEQEGGVHLSVSHTTRLPRPGERDGHDYHFVSVDTFKSLRDAGEFIEWAEVHGNFYGTSATWIRRQRDAGYDVLLEIDWQGARQVRLSFPDAIGIFILPPSIEELERRLVNRGQDDADVIARRVAAAAEEMRHVGEFHYAIINRQLGQALFDLEAVVRCARLAVSAQQSRHPELFTSLVSS
jgi:guanylate kinase